ncbi:cupin domain-containing protein [Streptomyces sioyaensis]|uniref:cupin domain-containing protein n=1 Tax=Streptomyces sioyaensis TaxID=67364 RepID=UPI0033FF9A5F
MTQGHQSDRVTVNVSGPVQVNIRKIITLPGVSTGKRYDHGQLVGVMASGTLTHYAPVYPGGVHVYRTGDSITESSGYIHEGRNKGTKPVVLWVTYMTPKGQPLAEPNISKCDRPKSSN